MQRHWNRPPAALAALLALSAPAAAQDAATFYKGRTVDIIVSSPPGGGYDAYSRIIARHMAKHMPEGVSLVVKNMAGAGGRTATTWLADVAPRDGTIILGNQPGNLVEQILGDAKAIRYDPLKFQYIGSAEAFTALCIVRNDAPVKTFAELMQKEAIFGGDQATSVVNDHTLMYKNLVGAKIKMITGYQGTSGLTLALTRGEIQGFCGYAWSSLFARSADLIEKGTARIIVQLGMTPHAAATKAGIPTTWDFMKADGIDRQAVELIATIQDFGRPFLVHGAVPADRVALLRAAFDATMKDKAYDDEIKKAKLDNSPITGQEVEKRLRKVLEAPKEVQARARWGILTE